jgi:acetyl esterase/lipase
MSEFSDAIRKQFQAGDEVRDAGLTTPDDIFRIDNIPYGPDPRMQLLDIYRPKGAGKTPLPVIVSFHGGAWVYGDKDLYQYYCMSLAQRGFTVINYSYRLAPESQFPAPLEDTNLVFTWLMDHAQKIGADTRRIFAVGDSAGANGLALYAELLTNPTYAAHFSFKVPQGLKIRALALNCGVYKNSFGDQPDDSQKLLLKEYLPEGGSPQELDLLDVTAHLTRDFPPTYLMTCTGDPLLNQAPLLAQALMKESIPFTFRFYGDPHHKELGHVFHLRIKTPEANGCNDDECEFFRRF